MEFPKQPSNIHSQSEPNSQLRSIKLIKSELKYVFGVREWMRDDVRSRQKKKSHEIFCVFSRYRRGKNWLYNRVLRTTAVAKLNSTDYFQCSQTPVYSFGSNYFANYIHGRRRQLQKQLCSIFFSNSPIRAREHTHRRVDDKWKCASLETVFLFHENEELETM